MKLTNYENGAEIEIAECLMEGVYDRNKYREITTSAGERIKVREQISEILTKARDEKNERLHEST